MRFLQSLVRQTVCIAMVAVSFAAHAQETYPTKPIKVVVPYPPGGGGDTLARLMLGRVAQELGQPVVIENLPGAGGNVGSSAAARAKPDGYTLLYGTNNTLAINRTLYKDPGFDVQKDLAPVSRLTQMGMLFVVKSDSKATTLKEAISMLKSAPDKFTFASSGNGTSSHLASEILKSQVQYSAVHVPYRGGAAALTALAGGEVDMMIEVMPSTVPLVKGGRLRALAATTPARTSTLPDVPTFVELGFPDFTVAAWDALMVPAGTPIPVIAKLNGAVRKALADPELQKQLSARGAEVSPTGPEETAAFLQAEIKRWGSAVRQSGAVID